MVERIPGLLEFLEVQSLMGMAPERDGRLIINGTFSFSGITPEREEVTDRYELEIRILPGFPRAVPVVEEIGGKIPRDGKFHVNGTDHTLCLGSPLRLLKKLSEHPTFPGFIEYCLVPYLTSLSLRLRDGEKPFVFGELAHGKPGLVDDYARLFGLKTEKQIRTVIRYLGMKKRRANKCPCPCGCGKRLGRCSFNRRVATFRVLNSRNWFSQQAKDFGG